MKVTRPGIRLTGRCEHCFCEFECTLKEVNVRTMVAKELEHIPIVAHFQRRVRHVPIANCPECGNECTMANPTLGGIRLEHRGVALPNNPALHTDS